MKVTQSIKSKLYRYFKYRLNLKKSTQGFLRGDCPYCGGKFTFGVNPEKMKVKCFKDCGIPYSPLNLIMYLENFETFTELRAFLNIQQEYEAYDALIKGVTKKIDYKPIELPKGYLPISMGQGIMAEAARKAMLKRGFSIKKLNQAGVGYCLEGNYMGYIIFPFYSMGKLEFFQGRKFAAYGPKMQNPKEEEYGIGKTSLIYNKDALFMYDRVYVVESITNALTLGDSSVALLGKTISTYQLSLLIKCPAQEIVLILDPDALKEAISLAMQLTQYKRIKLVYWEGDKDVNNLGRKETLSRVKQFGFGGYNDFLKLKNQLNYEERFNPYPAGIPPVINIKSYIR